MKTAPRHPFNRYIKGTLKEGPEGGAELPERAKRPSEEGLSFSLKPVNNKYPREQGSGA